jgi:hypothetical protein
MRTVILILFLVYNLQDAFCQKYLLKNEEIILSFNTKNHKKMILAKDKKNEYVVYRYGTLNKIELEYPVNKNKQSWDRFTYSYYFRGGGKTNAGMDLNYVHFNVNGYEYSIFYNYTAENESNKVGINIIEMKTQKKRVILGNYKTLRGTLIDFRENNLLKIDEDRID